MDKITLATPALLFSAVSLIMLVYTNRFLTYAQLVRNLHSKYMESKDKVLFWQIKNLRKRLKLNRIMQFCGIVSLLLSVISMFLVYVNALLTAEIVFGLAIIFLMTSLTTMMLEIRISTRSLDLQLGDMEEEPR